MNTRIFCLDIDDSVMFSLWPPHLQLNIILTFILRLFYTGVIPDNAFGNMILCRFGKDGHASRKYRRIMYWLPKFKNRNPYPIPSTLPDDPVQMAVIALKRMAVDWENKITVHKVFPWVLLTTLVNTGHRVSLLFIWHVVFYTQTLK